MKIKGPIPPALEEQWADADDALLASIDEHTPTNGSNGHVRVASVDDSWRAHLHTKRKDDGSLVEFPNLHNVCVYLRYHPDWVGVIVRDDFRSCIAFGKDPPWGVVDAPVTKTAEWCDNDTGRTINWFARMVGYQLKAGIVDQAVNAVADTNAKHEVREYLNALEWDGKPRVDALMHRYLGAKATNYTRAVGVCFMIGAVARVMQPGCKLDTLPILEGPQGSFKSTAVRTLCGDKWFCDSPLDIGSKDAPQNLPGTWIYELGEIDSYSKREVGAVKNFITIQNDRYRPSYGKRSISVARQCAFVGTVNPATYLQDETGGRRFHPVKVGKIDLEALAADRDQLWAEAVARFKRGEPWHLTRELEREAADEQEERREADPWEPKIAEWCKNPVRRAAGVTTTEVLEDLLKMEPGKQSKADSQRAGRLLQRLGWARKQERNDSDWSVREWRYRPQ